jgi:hypothetical protein
MTRLHFFVLTAGLALTLTGCSQSESIFPDFAFSADAPAISDMFKEAPPKIRQPVLPEMLVGCRGHVVVPALGMKLVTRSAKPPAEGQYLREERLTPPYRIIPFGARVSMEQSPQRLNVELDQAGRIIGLYCG